MDSSIKNSISTKELLYEYQWYYDTFSSVVQDASNNFFDENFRIKFIGLSKNMNCLLNNESCFVTKVKIEKDYDMFFRITEQAVGVILDKILGKGKGRFNLNKMSELETKIVTSFNAFLYKTLENKLEPINPKELKRNNFDMINMTFILCDAAQETKSAGKVIITLPRALVNPDKISPSSDKFSKDDFNDSEIIAKIIVGKTAFSLYDLKHLEQGDVVVFEQSKIDKLKLSLLGEEMDINISPNLDLIIVQEGDSSMPETHNLWDSIEVDMNAEFDAVKISLGELKKIESGIVVDLTSLYDNNVTLKVEGKSIASGSLVIVNDRYGVKIDKVYAKNETPQSVAPEQEDNQQEEYSQEEVSNEVENYDSQQEQSEPEGEEEDFDYSDFELDEDESI